MAASSTAHRPNRRFFAARALFAAHPRHRQYLLGGIAVVSALEAVYGLWQWVTKSPQVLWVAKTAYVDVATGTLINRNHYAALLYLGLGCTLALLMLRLDERPGREDAGRETAIRTTLALLAALQFAGIAASQSRAGIAGGLLVLGCALPLFLRARRAFRLAGLAVLAIVLLPTILLTLPQLLERLGRVPDEWSSAGGRGAVARTTARLVADFPLFGTGGASFEVAFARYRTPEISGLYDYAHNDYLQTLTETGVAGLAAALLPVALFVVALVRARRGGRFPDHGPPRLWPVYGALAALALHEFVDFNLQIPALAFVTALLAGAFFPGPAESRPAPRSRVLSVLALVVALPALAHGAARWPVVGPLLPAPDLPEAHAAAAMEALGTWRAGRTSGAEPAQAPVEDWFFTLLRNL